MHQNFSCGQQAVSAELDSLTVHGKWWKCLLCSSVVSDSCNIRALHHLWMLGSANSFRVLDTAR